MVEASGAADGDYLLQQRFRYVYAAPVRRLRHRLVVVPRAAHGDQRRVGHGLTVEGVEAVVSVRADGFGNHVVEVRAGVVDEAIEFEAWALVRRNGPGGETPVEHAALRDPRLLAATRLTRADARLADAAASLVAAGAPAASGSGIAVAERACSWAHGALTYAHEVTGVRTTAGEAVAAGAGVCQDYAHVMLALCRAAGVPARYVSGHLVGEGGSHAWVEVVVADPCCPGRAVAVAFDPTHDRRAARGYLTVAVGRDYTDVAPTSGTFEGTGPGTLSASKRLGTVDSEPRRVLAAAFS